MVDLTADDIFCPSVACGLVMFDVVFCLAVGF